MMKAEGAARLWLALGGLSGALAVGFGAYAAHGFPDAPQAMIWVEKASRYQMYHALALLALAGLQKDGGRLTILAGLLFTIGTVLFSGTLYALAFAELPIAWLVPVGGTSFILGWLVLGVSAVVRRRTTTG